MVQNVGQQQLYLKHIDVCIHFQNSTWVHVNVALELHPVHKFSPCHLISSSSSLHKHAHAAVSVYSTTHTRSPSLWDFKINPPPIHLHSLISLHMVPEILALLILHQVQV